MDSARLSELLRVDDPAWPTLRAWLAGAKNPTALWTTPRSRGEAAILALDVRADTTLGAMALYTAGLGLDGGWLRLLGAGGDPLGDGLVEWNGLGGGARALPGALIVAHDVLGGVFAVNGGAFGGGPGTVFYRSPRTGRWAHTGLGYTHFVQWCLMSDMGGLYQDLRWKGWEAEVGALRPDQGLAVYPYLWDQPDLSGAGSIKQRRRQAVPIRVLWDLVTDAATPGEPSNVGEAK